MISTIAPAALALLLRVVHAAPTSTSVATNPAPTVDLSYEIHQGFYSDSLGSYNFSNIPFAAPPVGELRWKKPQPPVTNRAVVNTGSIGRICPQASPNWEDAAGTFAVEYVLYGPAAFDFPEPTVTTDLPDPFFDGRISEDCLYLDVVVPKKIWDDRNTTKAPVLGETHRHDCLKAN